MFTVFLFILFIFIASPLIGLVMLGLRGEMKKHYWDR
jgi:preprotein translocase subunit SecG